MSTPNSQSIFKRALDQHQAGQLQAAEAGYLQVLKDNPEHADALHFLGVIHTQCGSHDSAVELIQRALSFQPNNAQMYLHMGNAFLALKKWEAAQFAYEAACRLDPKYPDAYCNLAQALLWQRKFDECLVVSNQAIKLNPKMGEVWLTKANCLYLLGQFEGAAASFEKTLSITPNNQEALMGFGLSSSNLAKLDQAIAAFTQLTKLAPNSYDAHRNLAVMYQTKGLARRALESFGAALAINPQDFATHHNKGIAEMQLSDMRNAKASFERALELNPDNYESIANLMYLTCMHYSDGDVAYIDWARRYGDMVAKRATPYSAWEKADAWGHKQPERLRVGIVSGDLMAHSVGFFVEGFVKALDPAKVHLVAYFTNTVEDAVSAQLKPFFNEWHRVQGLSDVDLAEKIHEAGIQVLVDLSGHTAHNRLPMFAFKPAPVQVSWLGFLASTGVKAIDYFLCDPVSGPVELQKDFTEKLWHLPNTLNCLAEPKTTTPAYVSPLPALSKGHVTFGAFQNRSKINVEVQQVWRQILERTPDANLYLICRNIGSDEDKQIFLQELENSGLPMERVTVSAALTHRDDLLRSYQLVDIALDPFPYPGVTTTCEALWMGVPVVTLAGNTLLGRQGAALMTAAGLTDWIAKTKEEYVDIAVRHASQLDKLAKLRAGLRDQAKSSPVFDTALFVKHWTEAMQQMWAVYAQQSAQSSHAA